MVTEVHKYIQEKASDLPEGHPDRKFLERISRTIFNRLNPNNYDQEPLKPILPKYREGAFFTETSLKQINPHTLTDKQEKRLNEMKKDIGNFGDEALSQLHLPIHLDSRLRRLGIYTISELRGILSDENNPLHGIGRKSESFGLLKKRLWSLDQRIQKASQNK